MVTAGRMGAIAVPATQTPGDVEGYPDAAQMELPSPALPSPTADPLKPPVSFFAERMFFDMDTYDLVSKHPLLAILRNVPLEKTIDYAEAAVQGGAPFFEVALNSPHALEQITMLRTHFGDRCTVGAGTAITVERCKAALDAGAQFLLTPGTPLDVFSYCSRETTSPCCPAC